VAKRIEPAEIPAFCRHCKGAVELQVEYTSDREALIPAEYDCPYCGRQNIFKLSCRLLWAVKRNAKTDFPEQRIV